MGDFFFFCMCQIDSESDKRLKDAGYFERTRHVAMETNGGGFCVRVMDLGRQCAEMTRSR